jgi:hypothetical protein
MLSSLSFANKNDEAKLKAEYGPELTHVPYVIRFAYNEKYHHDWTKTYYSDRKFFLLDYEANLAADQAKKKAEALAEADKEKARIAERKAELKKESDRLKAEKAKEKAQEYDDSQRQKEFNTTVSEQQKEIRDMQRQAIEERNNP